jgi:hypothetical protein
MQPMNPSTAPNAKRPKVLIAGLIWKTHRTAVLPITKAVNTFTLASVTAYKNPPNNPVLSPSAKKLH